MKKTIFITFLIALASTVSNAADLPLTKLCGTVPMGRATAQGSLTITKDKAHLKAQMTPNDLAMEFDAVVTKTLPAPIDAKTSDMYTKLGFNNPKDGTTYELSAVDSAGNPLKNITLGQDQQTDDGYAAVTVIPNAAGKNLVSLAVHLDQSGTFTIFYATDDCR